MRFCFETFQRCGDAGLQREKDTVFVGGVERGENVNENTQKIIKARAGDWVEVWAGDYQETL